jgi:hypothetical protein
MMVLIYISWQKRNKTESSKVLVYILYTAHLVRFVLAVSYTSIVDCSRIGETGRSRPMAKAPPLTIAFHSMSYRGLSRVVSSTVSVLHACMHLDCFLGESEVFNW